MRFVATLADSKCIYEGNLIVLFPPSGQYPLCSTSIMSSSRSTSPYSSHSQRRSPLQPITDAEYNARSSPAYGQRQSQLKTNCTWNTANEFGPRGYKFDEDRAPPRTMHLVPHPRDMCAHHDVLAHNQQFVSHQGQSQPGVDETWEAARRANRIKSQKAVEALGAPVYDSDMSPYITRKLSRM